MRRNHENSHFDPFPTVEITFLPELMAHVNQKVANALRYRLH